MNGVNEMEGVAGGAWKFSERARIIFRKHLVRRAVFLAFVLFAQAAVAADGAAVHGAFTEANRLYEQGKFREAAAAFQRMLDGGHRFPAVYFNAGNAWFKSGELGRAIAAYRNGQQLAPRDPDIAANLEVARNKVASPLPAARRRPWLSVLSLNEWTLLASGLLWVWFGLMIGRKLRSTPPARRNWIVSMAGVLAIGLSLVAAAGARREFLEKPAVVVVREAVVRLGPFDESPSSFSLSDGMEVEILEERKGWLRVQDSLERSGWTLEGGLERLGKAGKRRG